MEKSTMNIIEPKLLEAIFKEEWARYQPNPDPEYTNVPFKIDSIDEYESRYDKKYVQNTMIMIKGTARDNRFWDMEINLYQLMHVCKEWAMKEHNCTLSSGHCTNDKWFAIDGITGKKHEANTEPEAIFVACAWILEQQNKKGIKQ